MAPRGSVVERTDGPSSRDSSGKMTLSAPTTPMHRSTGRKKRENWSVDLIWGDFIVVIRDATMNTRPGRATHDDRRLWLREGRICNCLVLDWI